MKIHDEIVAFTEHLHSTEAQTIIVLHGLISSLPQMELRKRFGLPFYYARSWICYLNPLKKGGVELCFLRGIALSNDHGLLSANGRKQVAGIFCESAENLPLEAIHMSLQEALALDKEVPYKHPGKR